MEPVGAVLGQGACSRVGSIQTYSFLEVGQESSTSGGQAGALLSPPCISHMARGSTLCLLLRRETCTFVSGLRKTE